MLSLWILLVLVLLLLIGARPRGLCGFWVGSDEFTNAAGIDRLWITFGSLDMKMRTPGYIVLQRDGKVVINEPFVAAFKWRVPFFGNQSIKLLDFDVEGMPNSFTIEKDGPDKIKMFHGKTLWGILYRDAEKSDMCKTGAAAITDKEDFD